MNTSTFLDLLSHTALKGAAVLLVALLLGLGLRRMAAARRYALWITAVITLALLPLAMGLLPAWHVLPKASGEMEWPVMEPPQFSVNAEPALQAESRAAPAPAPAPGATANLPVQAPAPPAFSWNISWQDVVETLPLAWMLIVSGLLLRLAASAWRLHRLEVSLRPGECALLEPTARELALKRMPRLLIGPADSVPMVWGVFRPRLLLPQGFESWPHEKQRSVLLHELAHLRRGDPLALWLAQWVKALHWFNPLAWLTLRQLRADQERACDDAVLRQGVRASDYAQTLLDLSRHNRLAAGLSLCALTITRCAPVEARVKAILDPKRRREGLTLRWLAGLAGGALLITLPVAMLNAIEGPALRGRILDRNGVVLAESTKEKVRVYPLKTLAAHMIGYVRVPDEKHPLFYGGAGLEKQQDFALAAGRDVALTLDMRIQSLASRAMKEAGVTRGAAVVLDPRTGEILAAVSLPSIDPNLFVPSITQKIWERYLQDRDVPLLDRVSSARSAPGAVFQPFTALAALQAGKTPGTYTCTPLAREPGGGVRYGSVTRICRTSLREGAAHGPLTLEQALAKGCFSYFFQLGTEVGYPALFSMAEELGLQQDTHILGVKSPPLLPSMEELAKTRSSQRQLNDFTTDVASGRGSPATVLQMAALYSALANGKVWEPSLTKKSAGLPRLDLNSLPGLPEGLARVRSALREAVIHSQPWARSLTSSKAQIAALADSYATGAKGPHSEVFTHHYWMAGYAPADRPALAFALYVDETSPGSTLVPDKLGPMVRRVVEETLALPADGSGEVKAVEEKSAAAQAKFDFDAAEISREIKLLKVEPKISFKEFKIGNGRVTIIGDASGIDEALQLRKGLEKIGEKWPLLWSFPLPRSLANERVEFQAYGVYQASPSKTEEGSRKTKAALQSLQRFQKTAKVIGRSSGSLVINKGSLDGIVANSPVITSVGLVGKTATPEPYFTEVILLTDARCLVSAKVEGTLEQGILNGEREVSEVRPQLHLRFLNRHAKINVGSRVYSSGEGGVFPADLPLGRVKHFKSGDVSGEAIVEPVVDFSTLDRVFVIEAKAGPPEPTSAPQSKPADQAQDADIVMDPQLAAHWKLLQRKGFLADLPAKAVITPSKLGNVTHGSFPFQFAASREDAQYWLANSLGDVMRQHYNKQQPWPEKPGVFDYIYEGFGGCMIHIKTLDSETVEVRLWLKGQTSKSMLIAPDEAAPPTPKTAAPRELSGVVSNDTPPMEDAGQRKLEFDAEEISRQIRLLASKTGVSLREFKNGGGKLSFIGLADHPDDARRFGDGLAQGGKQWGIAWKMTTPAKVPDRPVTMFMAVGVHPTASISAAISSPPYRGVSAAIGVVSPLSNWRTLQQFGKLADLPAGYAPERITPAESLGGPMPSVMYAFTASRKGVHAWLSASLSSKRLAAQADKLRELGETKLFQHDFVGQDGCRVHVECDEDRARVLISRMTRIFEIAPDETQKPRPAGKLAPEYHEKGLTQGEAMPALDVSSRALSLTVSPQKVRLPTFRPQPALLRLRVVELPSAPTLGMPSPLKRLQGELSAESETALRRSLGSGTRMQQTLIVKPPKA